MFLKKFKIFIEMCLTLSGKAQGCGRGGRHHPLLNPAQRAILNHLCKNRQVLEFPPSQSGEHSVGHRADAGLDTKGRRQQALVNLMLQKGDDLGSHRLGIRSRCREVWVLIRHVGDHDSGNFLWIQPHKGIPHPLHGGQQAPFGIRARGNVVKALQSDRVQIQFQNHLFGAVCQRHREPYRQRRDKAAVLMDQAALQNSYIHLTELAPAQRLGHPSQMDIGI